MLGNSVVVVVVVVVVVRTRPRAIPLAMITMGKSTHGFPLLSRDKYGAPLGGPSGRRSSAINYYITRVTPRNNVLEHAFKSGAFSKRCGFIGCVNGETAENKEDTLNVRL